MTGLSRDSNHIYTADYPDLGITAELVSITTAMKAVDKSGPLIGWAKRITAEAAVRNVDMVKTMIADGGPQAAVDYLKKLADHKRDSKADLGTRVHAIAEAIANGQDVVVAEDEAPYVAGYQAFLDERLPRFTATEYMVCSLEHGYAGTGDLVVWLDCPYHATQDRWRLDTKTSAGTYAETALQLAAAHYAEFCGRPGDPVRYAVPRAEHHGVLHLKEDGSYAVVPYEVTQDTFAAFLASLRLWRWLQKEAKTTVGQPLPIALEAAA